MLLGFGRNKKLARYKRFNYEPRAFNAESESFRVRKNIIKKQLEANQEPISLEKEAFLLSKKSPSLLPLILFMGFVVGAAGFYYFYSLVKVSIGKEVAVLGTTWGANELGQFACLALLFISGVMFIRKSKKI